VQVKQQRLHVHRLGLMPHDDALRLFRSKLGEAASQQAVCSRVEEKVVEACGRLPLAVEVVGGYLAGVEDEEQWQVLRCCVVLALPIADNSSTCRPWSTH
jgi:hypothetical protein